ncbi:hypothetical protein STEG23_011718 [Scotinomys teguina]
MDSQSRCVVVTGFGPFRQHLVNSSWEAVKELSKLGLGVDTNIQLRTMQLPVDYREVRQRLTTIWEDFQPQLAVHVGMDTSTKAIFLEQCGKNRSYRDTDIRGFQPEGGVCLSGGPEVMLSVVSMKEVCGVFLLRMSRWPFPEMRAGTLQVSMCQTGHCARFCAKLHTAKFSVCTMSAFQDTDGDVSLSEFLWHPLRQPNCEVLPKTWICTYVSLWHILAPITHIKPTLASVNGRSRRACKPKQRDELSNC